MGRLTGKKILITGGTTGIGFATAKLCQAEGALVMITGQDPERLNHAVAKLGSTAVGIRADVSSKIEMEKVAEKVGQEFGLLDGVFANAGIAKPMPISELTTENIEGQLAVNFIGVLYTVQCLLPVLRNPASIVLTSTTMTEKGIPGMSVYAATKAAVRSLARTLSAELLPQGIRVNSLSPGLIETPIYGKLGLPEAAVTAWANELLQQVPAKRFGQAEEIATAAVYLLSAESQYLIGQDILVDGGVAAL